MDPNAALRTILEQGMDAGITLKGEYRKELNAWLAKGGFAPRVELHPGTDAWMRGDRFGTVTGVTKTYVWIVLDRSGQKLKVRPEDIARVGDTFIII